MKVMMGVWGRRQACQPGRCEILMGHIFSCRRHRECFRGWILYWLFRHLHWISVRKQDCGYGVRLGHKASARWETDLNSPLCEHHNSSRKARGMSDPTLTHLRDRSACLSTIMPLKPRFGAALPWRKALRCLIRNERLSALASRCSKSGEYASCRLRRRYSNQKHAIAHGWYLTHR